MDVISRIAQDSAYLAHGYCLLWTPWLVILHAASDVLIAASYYIIPLAIFAFIRQRKDLGDDARRVAMLFVAFIVACGTTHLIGLTTLWLPIYQLDGIIKGITAVISMFTAIFIWQLLPKFLALPSPMQLEATNKRLRGEVEAHQKTLDELNAIKRDLEDRVQAGAAKLAETKLQLDSALKDSDIAVFSQDRALRYRWVQGAREHSSFSRYVGLTDEEALQGPSAQAVMVAKRHVMESGRGKSMEAELLEEGLPVWYRLRIDPLISEQGIDGVLCSAFNITHDKRIQQNLADITDRLAASVGRLETVLRKSDVTVFEQDQSHEYVWISGPFLDFTPEEIFEKRDEDIFPAEVADKLRSVKKDLLKHGDPVNYEFQLNADDERRWFDLHMEVRRDRAGVRTGLTGAFIEVTERKKLEIELRILLREVTHRSKNLLAVIQSMARQSASGASNVSDFVSGFERRLAALAKSHDLLVEANWKSVSLAELVKLQLLQQGDEIDSRIHLRGPDILLPAAAAQHLGLAFHELGTNALKYGALSVPNGDVHLSWGYTQDERLPGGNAIFVEWVEKNGPPVKPPKRQGFGYVVIERIVSRGVRGFVDLAFEKQGFRWKLVFPRSQQED